MDLILWRHAEAEDLADNDETGGNDLSRRLTHKGEKQAARMAAWLQHRLPEDTRVWSSPAVRTEQTVRALGRKYRLCDELRPGASPEQLLQLVGWPLAKAPVRVVGPPPTLGETISRVLGLAEPECPVKKGAIWWLRSRERESGLQTVVVTVQAAELL